MRRRTILSTLAALLAALPAALPAAALDVDLVVQMPLAVVEVEEAGYPPDDLALLAGGLAASELSAGEVIDVLRWAPAVWYLDELADAELFVDDARIDDELLVDPLGRRLRLIEDDTGVWLVTTREDLAFVDLADRDVERWWLVDDDAHLIDLGLIDRDVDRDDLGVRRVRRDDRFDRTFEGRLEGPGMGAYVQFLHDRGLRGRALADAIHAELRRRGVPAGGDDRLDGPPPVSPRFVIERMPAFLVVDGRRVDLRRDDGRGDGREAGPAAGRRWLPPGQAKKQLAEAAPLPPRGDRVGSAPGRAEDRGGPPADRGRAAGDDRRGGPPPTAGPPPGRGRGAQGSGKAVPGSGRDRDGGPPAARRGGGDGRGKPAAARGGGGGRGKPAAARGGGGGGDRGKAKAAGGGRGGDRGKGAGGGRGGGQGRGRGQGGGR